MATGHARTMRSRWTWAPVALGAALLVTVEEAFGDDPLRPSMVELLTRSEPGSLSLTAANGRGGFVLQGTIHRDGDTWIRLWDMWTAGGHTIKGRDRLTMVDSNRLRWIQELDQGDGWREVPYSPFDLTRVSDATRRPF